MKTTNEYFKGLTPYRAGRAWRSTPHLPRPKRVYAGSWYIDRSVDLRHCTLLTREFGRKYVEQHLRVEKDSFPVLYTRPHGQALMRVWPSKRVAAFTACAIRSGLRGHGGHRDMIEGRLAYLYIRLTAPMTVFTWCRYDNAPSLRGLISAGFRPYRARAPWSSFPIVAVSGILSQESHERIEQHP